MDGYRILSEAEYRELRKLVERAFQIMENAGELKLPPSATASRANGDEPSRRGGSDSANHVGEDDRYRIARGAWSYADVVDREVDRTEFSLDHACEIILPLVRTKNKRPRDSLRTALDRDDRYERLSDRDDIWWRRVDQENEKTTEADQLSPLAS